MRNNNPHIPDRSVIGPHGKSFNVSRPPIASTVSHPTNGYDLKLHIYYSKSFNDAHGISKINTLMGHSNTIMMWDSLDAKFALSSTTEYLESEDYFNELGYLSSKYLNADAPDDADLFVFLTD